MSFQHDTLREMGYVFDTFNGEISRWLSDPAPDEVITALNNHSSVDEFIKIDLDTIGVVDQNSLRLLKTYQCGIIAGLRAKGYEAAGVTPQQMMNSWMDGTPTQEALEALRTPVKTQYPWPGSYR